MSAPAEPPAMRPLPTLLWAKGRMSRHWLASIRRESRLKVTFIALSTIFLLLGAFGLTYLLLSLFSNSRLFGFTADINFVDVLLNRMLSVLALTLFVLLVVSNLLVSFATIFRAKEVATLVQTPIPVSTFYLGRLAECVTFSSWGVAFLGAPVLLAYGMVRDLSPLFYLAAVLLFVPFVTVPAAIGSILSMTLVRLLAGRRRAGWYSLGGGIAAVGLLATRDRGPGLDLSRAETLQAIVETMSRTQSPFFPSHWFAEGLLHAAVGNAGEAAFNGMLLLSWAMLLVFVGCLVAERSFYVGWTNLLAADEQRGPRTAGFGSRLLEGLVRWSKEPSRSLTLKDLRLFVRDPAQWSQFLIFFGLLGVYLANMRLSPNFDSPTIRSWVAILNMAASMLVLATLTTRFIFPLISLEGRRFWILGLAPLSRRSLVLQKFRLSVVVSLSITLVLAIVSARRLELAPFETGLTLFGVVAATLALSALAVGLGSLYPNFEEDNPNRITSGVGGTLNFILSFGFIVAVTTGQAFIVQWRRAEVSSEVRDVGTLLVILALLGITAVATWLPLRLGIRALEEAEL